jgi:hypothetical protein
MTLSRRILLAASLLVLPGVVHAADLPGTPEFNQCIFAVDSQILTLPEGEIKASVLEFYHEGKDAAQSEPVIRSRSPAFLWAVETKFQCGKASGYFKGGYLDEDTVQKCDCAHSRYLAYR